LPEFLDFFHRLGGKEILWEKRNFGDCKRIFEQAVVEALSRSSKFSGSKFKQYQGLPDFN
jgi:hypothetical protein